MGAIMKTVCALLLVGVSIAALGQSEVSNQIVAVNPPFKLNLTANLDKNHSNLWDFAGSAETIVKAGSMVVVAVRKTNISDHEIDKSSCVGDDASGYHCGGYYEVRDSRGNLVRPRKSGLILVGGGPGHLIGTKDNVLQPGESNINHGPVSEAFDMSKLGTYTIQLRQNIGTDPKSDVVRSNIITVKVIPAEGLPRAGK
jgi:hypothetical protein